MMEERAKEGLATTFFVLENEFYPFLEERGRV